MISRRTFIKGAGGCVLGMVSVGGYSHFLEPRWVEINNVTIKLEDLPTKFEGLRIAQLSDIHHCEYVSKDFIRNCVHKTNALCPDVIVLTGDYVFGSNDYLSSVAKELSELKAKEGVFAILGNHDDKGSTYDELQRNGIRLLINEHIVLYRDNAYIFIAGIDDLWKGEIDIKKTLKGMDENPKILLAHNPDVIETIQYEDVDFVISGHTHGGQVCFPFYGPPIVYSKFGARYAAGLFRERNTLMYVNRGIGVSNLPVRFFARPEITLFTIRNGLQQV
ncbi:MAG: metallophosphoesterase [Candidatus Kuenenia stuttgartiensis]|jgi:predicted MPP superfamily phosphohydrolase|uniref:Calcineurin-like phosphoesterase domain-containing protein n=1 Tax=Kuenenia stuttgartiensis TaxID=174633 RepID=A0A2C9CC90_KUEST|nr:MULTISPECIES: metallophosphoesterase [Kuenenia]MBE7548832.1 metallophosphoesterase [Planctomycetia bacterium]MBW7943125.1 metallophosphoesterase [Candidatus Kuenenia stuttgartiensis]MBZ0190763.1 metallophosphoesterase [Candidatus Kuenenia stuttgartiensis]MCL4728110.1 metallophosphoesterase [Candidatus Kuenenia stuttgartiensis]MCZ7622340.1 metallophosphoesterase [Candidatus Kuenenia sp.]